MRCRKAVGGLRSTKTRTPWQTISVSCLHQAGTRCVPSTGSRENHRVQRAIPTRASGEAPGLQQGVESPEPGAHERCGRRMEGAEPRQSSGPETGLAQSEPHQGRATQARRSDQAKPIKARRRKLPHDRKAIGADRLLRRPVLLLRRGGNLDGSSHPSSPWRMSSPGQSRALLRAL